MKLFQSRLEKDFEFFVKSLPNLEPIEFCGLAKILNVPMVHQEKLVDFKKEDYEAMEWEEKTEYVAEFNRPLDTIMEELMDKYLELSKHQRKEINQMLKDIKRGK